MDNITGGDRQNIEMHNTHSNTDYSKFLDLLNEEDVMLFYEDAFGQASYITDCYIPTCSGGKRICFYITNHSPSWWNWGGTNVNYRNNGGFYCTQYTTSPTHMCYCYEKLTGNTFYQHCCR